MNDSNAQILPGIYRHAFREEVPSDNAQLMVETETHASLKGINPLHAYPLAGNGGGDFRNHGILGMRRIFHFVFCG
jgi:hypothetical protein